MSAGQGPPSENLNTGGAKAVVPDVCPLYHNTSVCRCWASSDLGRAKSLGTSSGCTVACTGKSGSVCGGPWANQVYTFPTCSSKACFTSVGCFADCNGGRALPVNLGSRSDMTPSRCVRMGMM